MPDTGPDTAKASRKWSDLLAQREAPGRAGWFYALDHPRVQADVRRTLGGLDPFAWVRPRVPQPVRRALEIGCGAGDNALTLARQGWFTELDAFDVAEGAIAAAQAKAAAAGLPGLNFFTGDGNTLALRPGAYDLIYANHALHHIEDLEHLFAQCAAALAPGGLLFASDYIGPSRMQYTDAHLALMNDALARIPPEKRADACHGGRMKLRIERTPLQAFLDYDPSEAPRSAEIIPALRRHFDVEVVPYGMSLTYEVLLGLIHHFDPGDDTDNALLDRLLALDHAAEAGGTVDTLFATLAATPREGAVSVPVPRPRAPHPQPAPSPVSGMAPRTWRQAAAAAGPSRRLRQGLEGSPPGRGPGPGVGDLPGQSDPIPGQPGPPAAAGSGTGADASSPDTGPMRGDVLAPAGPGPSDACPPRASAQALPGLAPAALDPGMAIPDFAALGLAGAAEGPGFHTVAGIEGWLRPDAAALTARLCRLQAALRVRSGVLELGVYRGKYLALLAALHGDAGVPVVGVDMFIQRIGESIEAVHVAYFVALIVDAVLGAAPRAAHPRIIAAPTADVTPERLLEHCPAGFSFISVDAGHEVGDVMHDLGLAAAALAPMGIVALDDAFHGALPGVSEGLVRFLLQDGAGGNGGGLAAFAFCGNKLFLCRPAFHQACLAYARWLLTLPGAEGYLARTADQDRTDRALGFIPRLAGWELVAFVPPPGPGTQADAAWGQDGPEPPVASPSPAPPSPASRRVRRAAATAPPG